MKETGVSCKVPSVGPGKENRRFFLKRPKVSDGFQGRVLLSVVCFVCLFFNVSDLLLSKASFKILHSIFPVWRNS